MKHFSALFSFFIGVFVFSQNLQPIQTPLNKKVEVNTTNFNQFTSEIDNYWQETPHDFKGSGVKPYQRWKELWQYRTKPDGSIQTAQEIADSWNNVMQLRTQNEPLDDNSNWIPLGPFSYTDKGSWSHGQGRVNVVTVDPSNPNTIYIGAPNGGIWRSLDHGNSWTSLGDNAPFFGVSGIAVDYNNSNIIYISTGDEDAGDSYSNGVYKSTDGGNTWLTTGTLSGNPYLTGEIYINPNNSNMLWVCSNSGFYKSIDAGNTWQMTQFGDVSEIRLKPNDPNTVYIVKGAQILKSIDAGSTFTTIYSFSGGGRTVIDVTDANPDYLYALSDVNNVSKVVRTIDSGANFTIMNQTTDLLEGYQSWYDLAIAVSDTNANEVYTGCLNIWKSTNGGLSFSDFNSWSNPNNSKYTHGDIHDIKFYNDNIYVGTDGGIYTSTNNGITFEDKTVNGLNISQYYRIDVAQTTEAKIVGGLQDNGGFAYSNNNWYCFHGADGMDAAIDPTSTNDFYSFIQYGWNLYKYNAQFNGNGQNVASSPNNLDGNWVTPLEFGNSGTLYAGYNKLYKLVSGQFILASSQFFSDNIRKIRVAHDNDNLVLVYDGNNLYKSDGTANVNFSVLSTPFSNIINFDFNRLDSNIIYVTTSTSVYKSINGGSSWTNITGSLPTTDSFVAIIHQSSSVNNTVYVASTNAVYYTNDTMTDWQIFSTGLPHTTITDIEINNVENHVLVSTYGRGVWRTPVDNESLAVEDITSSKEQTLLYPNPVSDFAYLNINLEEKATFEVYNLEGKLLKQQKFETISKDTKLDFSTLPKGTYIVRIISATHHINKKIIKK